MNTHASTVTGNLIVYDTLQPKSYLRIDSNLQFEKISPLSFRQVGVDAAHTMNVLIKDYDEYALMQVNFGSEIKSINDGFSKSRIISVGYFTTSLQIFKEDVNEIVHWFNDRCKDVR